MLRAGRQIAPIAAVGEPAAIVPTAGSGGGANGHSSSNSGCHGSRATMAMTIRAIGAMRSMTGARPPRPLFHEYDAGIGGLCLVNSGLHRRRRNRTGIRSRPCKRHGARRNSCNKHLLHTFSLTFQFARHYVPRAATADLACPFALNYLSVRSSSTRRLSARPCKVVLPPFGFVAPKPPVVSRSALMPSLAIAFATEAAR